VKDVGGAALQGSSGGYERNDQLVIHKSDFNIVAIDYAPALVRSVDYSLATIIANDCSSGARSEIDAQLLLIQDKVNEGENDIPR
jgi:hypothetical protein